MTKVKIKPSNTPKVKLPPSKTRRIDPKEFAEAIGAEEVPEEEQAKYRRRYAYGFAVRGH